MSGGFAGIVGSIPLFAGLEASAAEAFLRIFERVSFAQGATLVRQGQPADSALILERGSVEVITTLPGGGMLTVAALGPGAVLGEMALLESGVRSATVVARTPVAGYAVDRDAFRALLGQRNDAAFAVQGRITRTLCERLRELNARIVASGGVPAQSAHAPERAAMDGQRRTAGFDYRAFLPILPLFRRFHGDQLDHLMGAGTVFDLPRGSVIFQEGDASDAACIVVRGAVEITKQAAEMRRRIGILGPGRLCGILALIEGMPHSMTAAARELTTLFELKQPAFDRLFQGCDRLAAGFQDAINRELLQALARTNNHLTRLISQAGIRSHRDAAARGQVETLQRALGEQDCRAAQGAGRLS